VYEAMLPDHTRSCLGRSIGMLAIMNTKPGSRTRRPSLRLAACLPALLVGSAVGAATASPMQDVDEEMPAPWWTGLETRPLFPDARGDDGLPVGWTVVGGPATYTFETDADGTTVLHGVGGGPRNAFLVDPTITGDFLLELDVKIDRDGGNSGIQIRSTVDAPKNRMFGYQIEVDPSERAWSGGLYDEGRRGWIASLADNADAREAFVPGEWNHYTILALGPRIRTWINGVPAVDHVDLLDAEGRIGLQVHSGRCDVRWRNLRIADLGRRTSTPLLAPDLAADDRLTIEPPDGLVPTDGGLRLDEDGVTITATAPWPDGPSGLRIETTVRRGALRLVLGDDAVGPGYIATIPAPIGGPDQPGVIRAWRWMDRMLLMIDDVPLTPGPIDLDGPLTIRLENEAGTIATVHRIDVDPPTDAERTAIAATMAARSAAKPEMNETTPDSAPESAEE